MNRLASIAAAALFVFTAHSARAEEKKPAPAKTSTAGMSKEEIELARYLDVLEDMDLLENWELAELLSVLEDDDDR